MRQKVFEGAGVALVTPFVPKTGEVNYTKLDELLDFHLKNGTEAFIVAATTGENPTLSEEENIHVVAHVVKYVNGRIPVIAGAGSNDTRFGTEQSRRAEAAGADALLLVTPYYNKTTQRGLVLHFGAMASAVNIPILLYNVPARTGMDMKPETVAALMDRHENIVGIKECVLEHVVEHMYYSGGEIQVFSGEDAQVVPLMSMGGCGVISVLGNIAPAHVRAMTQACRDGNWKRAAVLQSRMLPLIRALFSEVSPGPVKEAMNQLGMNVGPCRLPLTEMEAEHAAALKWALAEYGLQRLEEWK